MGIDQNRISATISAEDLQYITTALAGITERLAFLPKEGLKKRMASIDGANKTFVEDVIKVYPGIAGLMPAYVTDEPEMKRDLELFEQVDKLLFTFNDLAARLKTTRMLAGLDAWDAAIMVYQFVKIAAKNGNPSAKAAFDQLKTRFAAGGRLSNRDETDPAEN